jgi:hypothetical protein
MITDYTQELTASAGHPIDFAAGSEYGSKPYDLKAAGQDPAVGEPLQVFMQVVDADVDNLDSLTVAVVSDTDGAGTSEVVVLSKSYALAALTTALGVRRVGVIPAGVITKQYLTAKLTTVGAGTATQGKVKVWLAKASDVSPQNNGANIA